MKRKKPAHCLKKLDLTQDNFYIVVANDLEEGVKYIKSVDSRIDDFVLPPGMKDCEALCGAHNSFGAVVFFRYSNLKASFICHEVTHATNAMLLNVGIPLTDETDEVYAYHNDMLFRYCVEFLKENKLKIIL